jgi:hypothetical protein
MMLKPYRDVTVSAVEKKRLKCSKPGSGAGLLHLSSI